MIRLLPISCSKILNWLTSNFLCHYSLSLYSGTLADQEILILNSGGAQIRRNNGNVVRAKKNNKAIVPADLQLSCKREQKQIIFGYAERSRQSMKLIVVQVRVRVKCIVDSYPDLISTTFANVPADLQSAGIKYKDLWSDYFLFLVVKHWID